MKTCFPKILITGGYGQVGTAIYELGLAKHLSVLRYSHKEMDITKIDAVRNVLKINKPDCIVNAAAFTKVDEAETAIGTAQQINTQALKNLAQICDEENILLVHISTDYIFDGLLQRPYLETDAVNPLNIYGQSKWDGEVFLRNYCNKHIILRTSGIFSEYGENFLKKVIQLASNEKSLRIVKDQITCPTYAVHLAEVIFQLIKEPCYGTYHYCDQNPTSWYEFAKMILASFNISHEIQGVKMHEFSAAAKRPSYSVLNCSKLCRDFALEQKNWKDGVIQTLKKLNLL